MKFKMGRDRPGLQINYPKSASQMLTLSHYGDLEQSWASFGETDERVAAVKSQSARNARHGGHGSDVARPEVGRGKIAPAGVKKENLIPFHSWGMRQR